MRKDLLAIGLGIVLSSVTVFSSVAADVSLPGHVPLAVSHALARTSGSVDSEKMMRISISLPLRNRDALDNLIHQLSDPKSPNYGHYLTPEQFTEAFGPTAADYQKVVAFAQANNLEITQKHSNRVLLSVRGKAADIEKAFHITLRTYQHPKENRIFFAPDTDPTVDSSLPILDVSGLDDYSLPHPNLQKRSLAQVQASPAAGSGPGGTYQGTDFRKAYVPGATQTGAGQNVGLVQFDGFFPGDIAAYKNQIGLGSGGPAVVVVPIDGGVPTPGGNNPEVSLDISMVMSMAPGVGTIYVYEAENGSPWVDILNRMVGDNSSKQLSSSWVGGRVGAGAQQIFQQMAVQGQSFYQASGDSDAYTSDGFNSILFPSDSPYITIVGGTTLTTDSSANYASETVWNWGITLGLDGVGSSGGISQQFTIPSWQTNINMAVRGGSSIMRNIPDVALTADNVLVFHDNGQSDSFGGTSCAAPLWAGFTALVNQQAAASSHPPVGFINPAIYAIAASANYATCFHDTTVGNNSWSDSTTLFNAVAGYDLCTGLGTPRVNLINALASANTSVSHISPPSPPYGASLSVLSGGNPNGPWDLFIQDDAPISSGIVANGWILSLTTADIIGTAADLELLMKSPNTNVLVGQPVTFTLTVTNYGPSISTNVTVVDTLPLTTVVTGTNATIGSVTRAGSVVTWNVGTLPVGSGGALVLTVQSQNVGSLFNQANAAAGTPDPNPDEDTATSTVNVGAISATLTPLFVTSDKTFHIVVPSGPADGITMVIQASSNLVSTNWVNIYTSTPPIDFTDPAASNYVSRFYRAILMP